MRTRDEIEGDYNRVKKNYLEPTMLQVISQNLMLEVFLDIRELLDKSKDHL